MPASLEPTFRRLSSLLREQQADFTVSCDSASSYCLEAPVGPATLKA